MTLDEYEIINNKNIWNKHNNKITRMLRCIKCSGMTDTFNFLCFDTNCNHEYQEFVLKNMEEIKEG